MLTHALLLAVWVGGAAPGAVPTTTLALAADSVAFPAVPPSVRRHAAAILAAAARHGVDPHLVAVVVWSESGGDPSARSPTGARGLMQLMPATAAGIATSLGRPVPTPDELDDVALNLELGVAHLAQLRAELTDGPLDAADVHRIAAAYNGGLRVALAFEGGAALPEETARYARRVADRWRVSRRLATK